MTAELREDHTIRVHLGIVAVFQMLVAVVTVAVSFALVRGDVEGLVRWRENHSVQERAFEKEYHATNESLIKTLTRLETTVGHLAEEVRELRRAGGGRN